MEGIDLFVKILSQCTRKEGRKEDEFKSLEVREASSSHLKTRIRDSSWEFIIRTIIVR